MGWVEPLVIIGLLGHTLVQDPSLVETMHENDMVFAIGPSKNLDL